MTHADLSVFKGIAGILASQGKFAGPLDQLQVEGKTTTPDFTVTSGGHPMMLKTEFQRHRRWHQRRHVAAPGGGSFTGFDPDLQRQRDPGGRGKGREVVLDVTASNARIEDLLRLAVKTAQPPDDGHGESRDQV